MHNARIPTTTSLVADSHHVVISGVALFHPAATNREMASKRSKAAPTDDELGELFQGIGDDTAPKKSTKAKPAAVKGKSDAGERDILAELENQLGEKTPSRPHTPRVRDVAPKPSPKRASTNTPPPGVDAATVRKSAESTGSYHTSLTPSATSSEPQDTDKKAPAQQAQAAGGGGWWGGLWSTATTAMKQAEAAVKEIQQNEEAKKWAEQVRGNVGALRGLGASPHT